jgi:hypothetical protein
MRLSKPAKILLGGVVVSAIIFVVGQFLLHNAESRLRELRAECERPNKYSELAKKLGGYTICDPIELTRMEDPSRHSAGVTAQLVAEQKKLWVIDGWYLLTAFVVLVLSAVPWLWYLFHAKAHQRTP